MTGARVLRAVEIAVLWFVVVVGIPLHAWLAYMLWCAR